MGRIWPRLKNIQFLLLFLVAGGIFFTATDNWGLYQKPAAKIYRIACNIYQFQQEGGDVKELLKWSEEEDLAENDYTDWEDNFIPGQEDVTGDHTEGGQPAQEEPQEEQQQQSEQPKQVTWQTVEDDYFDDALFIGDSRTVGMRDYGKLQDHATFYCSTGLTIFKLFTAEIVEVEGQYKKITVEEALKEKQFGKIYLMVGINEMGTNSLEPFEKAYRAAIEHIKELQPDAIIYIQSIMRVSKYRESKKDYINNEGINARNDLISPLADGQRVFYLDINQAVCDEEGYLIGDYTSDGVHLKAKFIYLWKDYLKQNAVVYQ